MIKIKFKGSHEYITFHEIDRVEKFYIEDLACDLTNNRYVYNFSKGEFILLSIVDFYIDDIIEFGKDCVN